MVNLILEADGKEYLVDARGLFSSTTPKISVIDLADKNSEYFHEFEENVKQFEILPTSDQRVKYSFTSGGTSTEEHIELDRFVPFEQKYLNLTSALRIYMKSDEDNTKIKILEWK